jgi:hypothetical protein
MRKAVEDAKQPLCRKIHDVLRQPQIGRSREWARTVGGFARLGEAEGDTMRADCGTASSGGEGDGRERCCATVMEE